MQLLRSELETLELGGSLPLRFCPKPKPATIQGRGAAGSVHPYEYGYDFKVIVTNKPMSAKKTLSFHNGRGAQEGVFAELKSQTQMDYVPTRGKAGNQVYLLWAVLAHDLNREMQMLCYEQVRNTTEKRAPLWSLEQLGSWRRKLIKRAGRLTKPQGNLTLTMSANATVKSELLHYLDVLKRAA